jgi:hypothetical protein
MYVVHHEILEKYIFPIGKLIRFISVNPPFYPRHRHFFNTNEVPSFSTYNINMHRKKSLLIHIFLGKVPVIKECQIYHLLLNIFYINRFKFTDILEKENESRVYETALIFKVPSVVKLKK